MLKNFLYYMLPFPFGGNSVPLGHSCPQSCSPQDNVFNAIVPFCDALRSLFVFVFPILISSIFPRKLVLTAFVFSDKCLPASGMLPKSVQYVLLTSFRLSFSTTCGKLSSSSHYSFFLILTQSVSVRPLPFSVRWVYHFDWKPVEASVGQCLM